MGLVLPVLIQISVSDHFQNQFVYKCNKRRANDLQMRYWNLFDKNYINKLDFNGVDYV